MFRTGYTENWSREIFVTDYYLNTNAGSYTIKNLNGEKILGDFLEKELLLAKL